MVNGNMWNRRSKDKTKVNRCHVRVEIVHFIVGWFEWEVGIWKKLSRQRSAPTAPRDYMMNATSELLNPT